MNNSVFLQSNHINVVFRSVKLKGFFYQIFLKRMNIKIIDSKGMFPFDKFFTWRVFMMAVARFHVNCKSWSWSFGRGFNLGAIYSIYNPVNCLIEKISQLPTSQYLFLWLDHKTDRLPQLKSLICPRLIILVKILS